MRGRLLVAAILALALTLRLGLALAYDPPPATGDAADYARHAASIADTGSYPQSGIASAGGPTAFRPPAYPLQLAAVYEVLGREDGPRVVGALVGTLAVALLGLCALWLFGRREALAALVLAAVFPPLIMVSVAQLSEGLFIALVLGALACGLAARGDERMRWVIGAGALAGVAALTRTNGLVILLPLLLAVPRQRIVLVAAALVVIAPWTIRNAIVLDTFVPTTTQAGFTLAGAYNEVAREDERFPAAWRPPAMYLPVGEDDDEAALERHFREQAISFMGSHPLYVPRVVFWATARMLNLADAEIEKLSAREAGVGERFVKLNRYATWVLLALAVAGALVARPPPWFWLFPLLLWLSVAIAIGATRYRTPVDPFLILLAACAVTSTRWRRA